MFETPIKVRNYTKYFRQEAVTLALKSASIARTAKELGVPIATMHSWIQQLKGKSIAKEKSNDGTPDIAALIEENRCLSEELRYLRRTGKMD